jgi:hypothetical protein
VRYPEFGRQSEPRIRIFIRCAAAGLRVREGVKRGFAVLSGSISGEEVILNAGWNGVWDGEMLEFGVRRSSALAYPGFISGKILQLFRMNASKKNNKKKWYRIFILLVDEDKIQADWTV